MTFESDITEFGKTVGLKKRGITTEETTKLALVLPFLKILGYDTENPDELKGEYAADVGVRKSEKIDLAVLIDGEVKMLIECKSANTRLNHNHLNQLFRYFSVSDVKIGILTNGVVYRFFTDFENPGRMDELPFLEADLRNLNEVKIESLKLFKKENFSEEKIMGHVEELKYRQRIHDVLLEEIDYPSDDLIRLIAKKVYDGVLTKKQFKYFEKLVREELRDVFENDYAIGEDEIHTSEEELEGFYIIRAILSEIADSGRIVIRDRKSYCAVNFDDNHNYPIARLYFNDLDNLAVGFFDSMSRDKNGSRVDEKIGIGSVSDIYGYKDKLLETVRVYLRSKG